MAIRFRLGLVINPLAGLGGSVALKGSDGVADKALAMGAIPKAQQRMTQALEMIQSYRDEVEVITASGDMGETVATQLGFSPRIIYRAPKNTQSEDTAGFVKALLQESVDLLLFAGGDGTARDIYTQLEDRLPVLGVPAGVKIHSGVYGNSPRSSGLVLKMLLEGQLVSLMSSDVMDIDESAFRRGTVIAKRFGEMQVPAAPRYLQSVKMGGKEVDELVLTDIAADVIENMEEDIYFIGSGSTVAGVMDELNLENTLLGVDVIQHSKVILQDASEQELLRLCRSNRVKLVITLIGGQGHILGRGNQQLSAAVIKNIGKDNIIIVATKTKLANLSGRPLLVDTGEPQFDRALCGYYKITTGFHDYVMYPLMMPEDEQIDEQIEE